MLVELAAGGPALSPLVAGLWRLADWNLDVDARVRWIERALELGISSFDHADIYGDYRCEALFGEALAAQPSLRRRIQLVTKCGIRLRRDGQPCATKHYDSSAAYVRDQVEQSLRKLGVERLDLVLIHRPDYLVDVAELAATFRALADEGKVAHWGVSNHTSSQFSLLHARHPLVTNQIELSPLHLDALDDGTLDQCQQLGVRPMVWSPLGGGRLFSGDDARARRVRAELERLAPRYRLSVAGMAFAWVLRHPSRPLPITGSGRSEALAEAAAALDVRLEAEDWYAVWCASCGHDVP